MLRAAVLDSAATITHSELELLLTRLVNEDAPRAAHLARVLERGLTIEPIRRFARVWDLSSSEAAAVFGVSRQAYAKWLTSGVPGNRAIDVAAIDDATEMLLRYVKLERIPAVVRREADRLKGQSLLELAREHGAIALREAVRTTFDLRRVQP